VLQVVRALESDSDRACLYQGMKPGQSMEYDSQFGREYNAGIRSFKKPMLGSQQFGLPQIRSGEFGLPAIRSGEFALPHSSEYNAINITSSREFDGDSGGDLLGDESRIDVYTAPRSGQFSSNNSGNMQQAGRPESRDSNSYTPPRSGQFAQSGGNPNNNNNNNNNNNGNRSGFFGQPPPRPPSYKPPTFSGEYIPIGKTVQFAPSVVKD
jgi:hypothetical protein